MRKLSDRYFDWMCSLVSKEKRKSYRNLFRYLNSVDFQYSIPLDANRFDDGIELRYRFGYERHIDISVIANELDVTSCSVFEMMIALSIRCEEHIMGDPSIGDRPGKWFWLMIDNLGLTKMDDEHFSIRKAESIINVFLDRSYSKDGSGGLFHIPNCHRDLRNVEIWYQMMWYLDKIM